MGRVSDMRMSGFGNVWLHVASHMDNCREGLPVVFDVPITLLEHWLPSG